MAGAHIAAVWGHSHVVDSVTFSAARGLHQRLLTILIPYGSGMAKQGLIFPSLKDTRTRSVVCHFRRMVQDLPRRLGTTGYSYGMAIWGLTLPRLRGFVK